MKKVDGTEGGRERRCQHKSKGVSNGETIYVGEGSYEFAGILISAVWLPPKLFISVLEKVNAVKSVFVFCDFVSGW